MTQYTITQQQGGLWLCECNDTPELQVDAPTPQEALADFLAMWATIEAVWIMTEAAEDGEDDEKH